ncbi:MAG: TIM44-like domain-containing protein, partial [Myxococcales bacterium]|nr:TIM44-like domain-containing protein [Myxococcales bacterium]
MRRHARFVLALSILLLSGGLACQKHGDKQPADTGVEQTDNLPSKVAKDDRLPALEGAAIGAQPAYMDGAFFYASARAGLIQDFLHSLPLGPREAKDFAELGQLIGADPRVDDLLTHFAIPANARISMSVRPVLDHAPALRAAVSGGGAVIDELAAGGSPVDADTPSAEEEPKPALSEEAQTLLRQARSLGFHVRLHVPSDQPSRLEPLLASMRKEWSEDQRWAETCAAIGPTRLCGGESDGVLVVRDVPGALQFDLYLAFESVHEQPDDEVRRALLRAALATQPDRSLPVAVASLRGDAAALVHGPTLVDLLRGVDVAKAVTSLSWSGREGLERHQKHEAALVALHETTRIFDGATLELRAEPKPPALTGNVAEAGTSLPTVFDPKLHAAWTSLLQSDPNLGPGTIEARVALIYAGLNAAWMARDLRPVRGYLSDGMADYLRYWIEAYLREQLINVLEGMRITNLQLVKVVRDRWYDAVTFRVYGSGRDYTVRASDRGVVSGDPRRDRVYSEYWTLIRGSGRRGPTRLDGGCPNCGAPLAVGMGGECLHCGAHVSSGEF